MKYTHSTIKNSGHTERQEDRQTDHKSGIL